MDWFGTFGCFINQHFKNIYREKTVSPSWEKFHNASDEFKNNKKYQCVTITTYDTTSKTLLTIHSYQNVYHNALKKV